MQRLYQLPQPTLAVVQGAAFGGALGLIACCDMAIGASDALFCLSEVRIGPAPAVISPFVVKAIGERATRRYALTAERFDGKRARELGLLAETYPASELDAALEQWVDNLLLNSPQALKACKDLLLEVGDGDFSADLRQTTEQAIARLRTSPEGQEGLSAFLKTHARPAGEEVMNRHIDTLLVANRGEIACRVMRTAKAMGLTTVAVHSAIDASARHAREADIRIDPGGAKPAESYLRIDKLIEAGKASGAQAIHRLRLPLGERRVRPRHRTGRADLPRPTRLRHRRHGQQVRRQGADGRSWRAAGTGLPRRSAGRGNLPCCRGKDRLPGVAPRPPPVAAARA